MSTEDHERITMTTVGVSNMAISDMNSVLGGMGGPAGGSIPWQGNTVLSGWVLAITQAIEASGVEVAPVLEQLDIDPALMASGFCRYEQRKVSRLWMRALSLCGDDGNFSLRVAEQVRPATFHVVGYAMNCSVSLHRALQRLSAYSQLISDLTQIRLQGDKSQVIMGLEFSAGRDLPAQQTVDTVLVSIIALLRLIAGTAIQPARVNLMRGPRTDDRVLKNFFACPVTYRTGANSLVFARGDLDQPLLSSDEELATLLDCVADRYMEKIARQSFTLRLRDVMKSLLISGNLSKRKAASLLHVSERTLLRKLSDEGTNFAETLRKLREELAFEYLRAGDKNLEEIASLLGFSDCSTFSRAFKAWTGKRPNMVMRNISPMHPALVG